MGDDEKAPLDTDLVRRALDGRYAEVRDRVRRELPRHAALLADAPDLSRDAYRDRVLAAVRALTEAGVTTFGLPTEYGGGGDVGAFVAAFETLAYGDLSVLVKMGVQFGLFGGAVLQLGTARHHRAHLPDVVAARLLGCFAMTEVGHGSDVQALATTATYFPDGDEFEIHTPHRLARKRFIGNAARDGRVAVVFAQLRVGSESHGVHAFLVPLRDQDGKPLPGISIGDDGPKMGLNGVDNGNLGFDHVRIPRESLLDRHASVSAAGEYSSPIASPGRRFFTMLGTLVQGRVSVAGAGIGAAQVALTVAVKYALRRRQFGGEHREHLLLDYRMHRRRLLPLLARTYALRAAQQVLLDDLDDASASVDDRRRRALEARAAGTKALASWHAVHTVQQSREACGGAGYLSENRFAALRADTDVFTTFEGDNHVLLQLVAKALLTDYASAFDEMDTLGVVRTIAGQAVEAVIERTALHQIVERIRDTFSGNDHWDADAGLRDPEYHLAMLRWREEHQLAALVRRIKHASGQGLSHDEVFDRVQPHLIDCGRWHVEREVLEAFVDWERTLPDGPERDAVNVLADLHALSLIESDRGWWMEHGRLGADRSKEITRTVDSLCDQAASLADALVDAFGVPRECWDVPMLDQDPGPTEPDPSAA